MRITLTGATGFLGQKLVRRLSGDGHSICLLSRKPVTGLPDNVEIFLWDPPRVDPPPDSIGGSDAVIHLAGAPVSQRWTSDTKKLLRGSRLDSTRSLVQSLSTLSRRPGVLLSASAIGYYGDRADEQLSEDSSAGAGFLASLSEEWEQQANLGRSLGMRVHCLRTGIVLGREGGALPSMLPPFRFGIGGKMGAGQQWWSWIHADDWVGAVVHLLEAGTASGPFNLTAPHPVRNAEFTQVLGHVLHRPALFTVPEFALRMLLGEMSEIILQSQKLSTRLTYDFRYPLLEPALRALLQ